MKIKFLVKVCIVCVITTMAFSDCVLAGFQTEETVEIRSGEYKDIPPSEWVLEALYQMLFEGKMSELTVHPNGIKTFKVCEQSIEVPENIKKEGKSLGTTYQIGNEKDQERFKEDHKKLLEDNSNKVVTCYFEIKSGNLTVWYTTAADVDRR